MSPSVAPRCVGWQRQCRLLWRNISRGWRGAESRQRDLIVLFRGVNAWLRASGAEHWIAYGTLLGWHRERQILRHDADVDFAAPVAASERIRQSGAQLPAGFALFDSSHRHRGPKLYITYRGREADIYFYRDENGLLQSTESSINPGEFAPFPRELVFPLIEATLHGAIIDVPGRAEDLLRHHYRYLGPDAVRDPSTRFFRPRQAATAKTKTHQL